MSQLTVRAARSTDADEVRATLVEAARWLLARGIEQWRPEDFTRDLVRDRIERGECYVGEMYGQIVGTFALQWADEQIWGKDHGEAAYVHALAVRRAFSGHDLGRELLAHARMLAVRKGKVYLRLDCWGGNDYLRAYYANAGFEPVGTKVFAQASLALFQRRLRGS